MVNYSINKRKQIQLLKVIKKAFWKYGCFERIKK